MSSFPRTAWLRALREALAAITDADLGYGDPRGVEVLRLTLADYLGRVRGVVAHPARLVVTSGYSQGQGVVCRALVTHGAKRIAFENPCHPEQRRIAALAGLEIVPTAVDAAGIRVDELERADVDAVVLTPAHQHPTGAVLSGERRTALLAWLRALYRQRHRATLRPASQVAAQPTAEPLPIGLPDPAPPLLARADLERSEGDLPPVQIQSTYRAHQGPPCSSSDA